MNNEYDQSELDRMRNDPENYKWGFFYYNSEDPRFILPKRNKSLGWTLNFANPRSHLVITGIIIFTILMAALENILE